MDDFRVFDRELTAIEVAELYKPGGSPKKFEAGDAAAYEYYLARVDEKYRAQLAALQNARKARNQDQDGVEEIMAMQENPGEPFAYVLDRGHYEERAEKIGAKTPAFLSPMPEGAPGNRLGLAQWLTDRGNPLTARVAVNRY